MDRLFSSNVEDKEVFFKKSDNPDGVVENINCNESDLCPQKLINSEDIVQK